MENFNNIVVVIAAVVFFLGYGVNHWLGDSTVATLVAIAAVIVGVAGLVSLFS